MFAKLQTSLKELFPNKEEFLSILPFLILLLTFNELGENIWRTRGHYHFRRLVYFLIPFSICVMALFKYDYSKLKKDLISKYAPTFFMLVFAYFFWKTARRPLVIYSKSEFLSLVLSSIYWLLFGLTLIFLFIKNKTKYFIGTLVLLFSTKVITLISSPEPFIDVFTSNTDGAKYLLSGLNPYSGEYRDIYGGRYDYSPGYVYWPVVPIVQSISYFLFKDIRASFIFFDIFTLLGLWKLSRNYYICILWFALPFSNFILEQSWIDTYLITFVIWVFYYLREKKFILSGLLLGLACATKQYGGIVAIILGLYSLKEFGIKNTLVLTISALVPFSFLLGIFLVWDFEGFIKMTMKVPLTQDFRSDSFSVSAALLKEYGIKPTKMIYTLPSIIGFIGSLYLTLKKRSPEAGLFILFSLIFLFGKQAFCNYYYFLSLFLILKISSVYPKRI